MKLNELYSDGKGKVFVITGTNLKDSDPWVTYENTQTEQEYSCRQEAFLLRFLPLPQSR
jgi:hypothetical protein